MAWQPSAQGGEECAEQVRGQLRILHQLVAPLVGAGIGSQPQHAGSNTVPKYRCHQPAFSPVGMRGSGAAGIRRVCWELPQTGLRRRRKHQDLLGQGAPGDRVRPLDARQRGVELALGE